MVTKTFRMIAFHFAYIKKKDIWKMIISETGFFAHNSFQGLHRMECKMSSE